LMAGTASVAILRDIQTLFDLGTAAGMTDRQLLERFADGRGPSSDAAFEVLILRHGPMVLRVCRNMLRHEADVADAFQATFLVLVRRRETLRTLESVGGWLYGVVCRVAARARVDAARRQKAEQRAALRVVEAVDPAEDIPMNREFGPVVQEEVRRLPEKYRAVVVLCYWQSLTHDQAAAQLGCPLGTVRSRLARARKLLHRRLTRRGLAPLAALVTKALDGSTVAPAPLAAVPAALVKQTIEASAAAASGQALSYVVSGATASLVRRVLWSMAMIKIKTAAVGLALVGLLGIGTAIVLFNGRQGKAQVTAPAQLAGPERPKDPPGTALLHSTSREVRTILTLVPNGSIVKKGEVVCELDPAEVAQSLTNQRITTIHARASHRRNETTLEIAELSLAEYQNGLVVLQEQETQAAINKAEANLATAESQFATKKTDKDAAARTDARMELELAQARKNVLLHYTKAKRIKELNLAIEVAKAEVQASKEVWELEVSKDKRLEREIETLNIIAPCAGKLVYCYGPDGRKPGGGWPWIEVGAEVQPNELLFKIVPVTEPAVQPK
jgi:HlyD family secretion protein